MMRSQSKRYTLSALLTAVGLMIGYIETFIVIPVHVPGIRLGLANTVSLIALYLFGPLMGFAVLIMRVLLSAILFGGFTGFIYSVSGAIFSFALMLILKHFDFSIYSVSTAGAVMHNIAQLMVAYAVVGSVYILYYIPALILAGIIAGLSVGFISDILIKRLRRIISGGEKDGI